MKRLMASRIFTLKKVKPSNKRFARLLRLRLNWLVRPVWVGIRLILVMRLQKSRLIFLLFLAISLSRDKRLCEWITCLAGNAKQLFIAKAPGILHCISIFTNQLGEYQSQCWSEQKKFLQARIREDFLRPAICLKAKALISALKDIIIAASRVKAIGIFVGGFFRIYLKMIRIQQLSF